MNIQRIAPEATRAVRHRVLWPHRATVADCTIDIDGAPHAVHLGALAPDVVGVLSLFDQRPDRFPDAFPADRPVYRLRAMGVLPEWRRQRVGEALIEAACAEARGLGAEEIWCDARKIALPFYESCGFRYLSELYDIPVIGPHRMMARAL